MFEARRIGKAKKAHLYQQDSSDCGVAALCAVVNYYGGRAVMDDVRLISGTTPNGTTMLGLMQAAVSIGLVAEGYKSNVEYLKESHHASILHIVRNGKMNHFVVCYGYHKNKFVIGDPELGVITLSGDELNQLWKSKTLLLIKSGDLVVNWSKKWDKYNWIKSSIIKDKNLIYSSIILGLLLVITNLASAIFIEKLIDNLLPSKNITNILVGLVSWLSVVILGLFFGYVRELLLMKQSFRFNTRLIKAFISKIFNLPKRFFESRKKGDLITRLYDTQKIQESISEIVGQDIIEFLLMIAAIIFTSFYSLQTTLILALLVPLYFIIIRTYYQRIYQANKSVLVSHAQNESSYIDYLTGISALKHTGSYNHITRDLNVQFLKFQKNQIDARRIELDFKTTSQVFGALTTFLILTFTISEILIRNIQIGDMIAIFSVSSMALASTVRLALSTIHVQETRAALDRTFGVMRLTEESQEGIALQEIDSIVLKEVCFSFNGKLEILKDINLDLTRSQIITIQGENGGGKSTLFELILLNHPRTSGEIFMNQKPVAGFRPADVRGLIGHVPQEVKIFNNSLKYNIMLRPDEGNNFNVFCEEYGFSFFFDFFEDGYETWLGEEGVKPSGGQSQMIALARAIFQKPSFLLLDEFTSNMDSVFKEFAIKLVLRLSDQMGIVTISHDDLLSNISSSVYKLKKGSLCKIK